MLDFSDPSTPVSSSTGLPWRLIAMLATLLIMMTLVARWNLAEPVDPAPSDNRVGPIIDATIDQATLASFVDHARSIEPTSYYALLDHARKADAASLWAERVGRITYAQLLDEPDRYRGARIHLQGRLHRLTEYQAQANRFGIDRQFEGWVFTSTSGSLPYVAVMASPPASLPMGENIHEPIEMVGYFLGWWRYETKEGKRTSAPLIMVTEMRPVTAPTPTGPAPMAWNPWLGILVTIGMVVTGIAWWWKNQRSVSRPSDSPTPLSNDILQFEEVDGSEDQDHRT
ncbi:hypothetical protein K2X85_13295 [bacterium]|nr:hypothetical protein [bacterium]